MPVVKTTHYCVNIRIAGAGRSIRMCSLPTVCSCVYLSGHEDHSAVIVEYCMSMAWPPMRIDDLKSRKPLQLSGNLNDNDQLIALKTALPESIACLLICFDKRQAKTCDNGLTKYKLIVWGRVECKPLVQWRFVLVEFKFS